MRRFLKLLFRPAQRAISCACAFGLILLPVSDYRPAPRPATAGRSASPQATPAPGQTGPQLPKPMPQSMVCALWRTDQGFVSTIRIKNMLITGPLTITPVLFMADGTEYDIAPVTLAAGGIASVDVNGALDNAPPAVANHLSQYGSAALRYQWIGPGTVSASTQILDDARSLIFIAPFMPVKPGVVSAHTLEGLWWKHDPGVQGFVALTNTTAQATQATLDGTTADGIPLPGQTINLPAHAMELLDIDTLFPGAANDVAGGVRVRFRGGAMDVVAAGGLMNPEEGYSAGMAFAMHDPSMTAAKPTTLPYASVGMLVGKPDPSLGFPSRTRFTPYAAMRNTTAKTLAASLAIDYMVGGQPKSIQIPAWTFSPGQSAEIPHKRILDSEGLGGYDGNITLVYSYTGSFGDLIAATGSVDQTGTYVFEVPVSPAGQTWAKELPLWTTANGSDTMIALWNSGTTPEDLVGTFTWNGLSGQYKLPIHLDAGASQVIDVAQLIALNKPDADGNTIPVSAREGSAMFSGTGGMQQEINLAVSGGEYNVATATCSPICVNCSGVVSFVITPSPFVCPYGDTYQLYATEILSNGTHQDMTAGSTWSSSNTSVATVSSSGLVTGVAAGSVEIDASLVAEKPGQVCATYQSYCTTGTF